MQNENLKREIGVRSLSLSIVNAIIGTGIFVIPALIAQNLGASAIIAYLICGALIFLVALCFAELGSKTTRSGGAYTYIEQAFGPYAGFMANNLYWLGACVVSDAALANALADTLKTFFPQLQEYWIRFTFFLVLFAGIAYLNIRSIKHGLTFIELLAVGKILPLILLILLGFRHIDIHNLTWTSMPPIRNIGTASLLLFYAFMGMETPLSNGGEIKNPKRTVPLSLLIAITGILLFYIAIQLTTQGILGDAMQLYKDAPIAEIAGRLFGPIGITIIIVTTAISMFGTLGGNIMSLPRIIFAGARDGLLPKVLSEVHPKYITPHYAIICYVVLGFIFAVSGGFKQLAILSSAAMLIIYIGVVLACITLRTRNIEDDAEQYKVPGGKIIPILAICIIVWLLSHLSNMELLSVVLFLAVFSVIYALKVYYTSSKQSHLPNK